MNTLIHSNLLVCILAKTASSQSKGLRVFCGFIHQMGILHTTTISELGVIVADPTCVGGYM